jgi:hypothetical protein
MSTAHSTAETDKRDDRVFENMAVSIVFEQLAEQLAEFQRSVSVAVSVVCQQAAKEQRSANEAIKAKRKDVSN